MFFDFVRDSISSFIYITLLVTSMQQLVQIVLPSLTSKLNLAPHAGHGRNSPNKAMTPNSSITHPVNFLESICHVCTACFADYSPSLYA